MNILTDLIESNKVKFDLYYKYLLEQNKIHNFTTIVDYEDVYKKDFLDSLIAYDIIYHNCVVLDIGAGAGFPSVPLKIVRDDITVTMLDSVKKKVNFLNDLVSVLGLTNIIAKHLRIEDYKDYENYDTVVSRAVANLSTLTEYALPFVKIGGYFLAYKSNSIENELNEANKAIQVCGGKLEGVQEFCLDGNIVRKLVIIKKVQRTPDGYPRGGNKPRLKPL